MKPYDGKGRLEKERDELKQDLDCGCGISGCQNMRRICANCEKENLDSILEKLTKERDEALAKCAAMEGVLAKASDAMMFAGYKKSARAIQKFAGTIEVPADTDSLTQDLWDDLREAQPLLLELLRVKKEMSELVVYDVEDLALARANALEEAAKIAELETGQSWFLATLASDLAIFPEKFAPSRRRKPKEPTRKVW